MGRKDFEEYLDGLSREPAAEPGDADGLRRVLAGAAVAAEPARAWKGLERFSEDFQEEQLLGERVAGRLIKEAPSTARFLSVRANARVAWDDHRSLEAFEVLISEAGAWKVNGFRAVARAFRTGQKETELGRLGYRAVEGRSTPEDEARIGELEKQSEAHALEADERGGFTGLFLMPAAKIAGQMYESGKRAVATGAAAGMTMGTAATATGPAAPVTAPAAALLGFGAGLPAGFMKDVMLIEGGHAYLEIREIRSAGGEAIPDDIARFAAVTVGVLNAAVEGLALSVIAAPFRRALKRFVLDAAASRAKAAMARRSTAGALKTFAKGYVAAIGAETAQEVVQETTNVVAEELAKKEASRRIAEREAPDLARRLTRMATELHRALGDPAAPEAYRELAIEIRAARRAEEMSRILHGFGEAARGSNLFLRSPAHAQAFLDSIADANVREILVPVDRWSIYWQGRGVDPAAAAAEVLGDPAAFERSLSAGTELEIPLSRYIMQIAPTEHHAGLIKDLLLRPGDMTAREAKAFRKALPERLLNLQSEAPAGE